MVVSLHRKGKEQNGCQLILISAWFSTEDISRGNRLKKRIPYYSFVYHVECQQKLLRNYGDGPRSSIVIPHISTCIFYSLRSDLDNAVMSWASLTSQTSSDVMAMPWRGLQGTHDVTVLCSSTELLPIGREAIFPPRLPHDPDPGTLGHK